jgi:hypothetical protein
LKSAVSASRSTAQIKGAMDKQFALDCCYRRREKMARQELQKRFKVIVALEDPDPNIQ